MSAQYPKVSIVSVSFQAEALVNHTLDSIAQLKYPNLEVIIVDNQSTDGTLKKVKEYGSLVQKTICEKDFGPYDAMNKGAQASTGEWIWFMNMGDAFVGDPYLINKIFDQPLPNDVFVVYGDTQLQINNFSKLIQYSAKPEENMQFGRMILNHQSLLCRRSKLLELGLFQFNEFPLKADCNFLTAMFFNFGASAFKHSGLTLAIYNGEGMSSNLQNYHKMYEEDLKIIRPYVSFWTYNLYKVNNFIKLLKVLLLKMVSKNQGVYNAYRKLKYKQHIHV